MISQMQAVTGRKPRRRYVDIINARLPYLSQLYEAREAREYNEEMLDLEREALEETERANEKALRQQEKEAETSNLLGVANLGLSTGLGLKKNKILTNILTAEKGKGTAGSVTGDIVSGAVGESDTGKSITGDILASFTEASTYGYGAGGGLLGQALGNKDREKSALYGGAAGFITSMLGKKGLYQSIVSGLIGGGIGGIKF